MFWDREEVAATVERMMREALSEDSTGLRRQMEGLDQKMAKILAMAAQGEMDTALLEEQF